MPHRPELDHLVDADAELERGSPPYGGRAFGFVARTLKEVRRTSRGPDADAELDLKFAAIATETCYDVCDYDVTDAEEPRRRATTENDAKRTSRNEANRHQGMKGETEFQGSPRRSQHA
eukprot:7969374-Pyramimonas_sp.AAC.1